MNILNVENVSKTYMSKPVLSGITVGIGDTDKIGVVGTNGTGKSFLLDSVWFALTHRWPIEPVYQLLRE